MMKSRTFHSMRNVSTPFNLLILKNGFLHLCLRLWDNHATPTCLSFTMPLRLISPSFMGRIRSPTYHYHQSACLYASSWSPAIHLSWIPMSTYLSRWPCLRWKCPRRLWSESRTQLWSILDCGAVGIWSKWSWLEFSASVDLQRRFFRSHPFAISTETTEIATPLPLFAL
jgi:hypothetical protein